MRAQAKELIELIFNSISHQTNSSMAMLSIINTVFLPLTFLAGKRCVEQLSC
jgi:Mg2+ and Co2+ transporter CorA